MPTKGESKAACSGRREANRVLLYQAIPKTTQLFLKTSTFRQTLCDLVTAIVAVVFNRLRITSSPPSSPRNSWIDGAIEILLNSHRDIRYTTYEIQVRMGDRQWSVRRRYSQFDQFRHVREINQPTGIRDRLLLCWLSVCPVNSCGWYRLAFCSPWRVVVVKFWTGRVLEDLRSRNGWFWPLPCSTAQVADLVDHGSMDWVLFVSNSWRAWMRKNGRISDCWFYSTPTISRFVLSCMTCSWTETDWELPVSGR